MAGRIIFNGKFLSSEPTGVHRVAEELIAGCWRHVSADPRLADRFPLELWVPHDARDRAGRVGPPVRVLAPFRGIPWEQLTLPMFSRDDLVVNLCNIGPILHRRSVTMIHDAQVRITPASYTLPFRLWYRLNHACVGRRHARILTVSEFSKSQLDRFGIAPADRVDVIHNGVDHVARHDSEAGEIARLGLERGGYVVALANEQPHKNIGLLLRLFERPAMAGLRLVLVGRIDPARFAAAGLPLPSNVVFAGRVSDGALRALYEGALAQCFPSLTEGFGLPPLEAMYVGCPALVAPEGALPEVCADNVLYADARDPAAWEAALLRLRDDAALRGDLAERGRRHASRFTWQEASRKLVEVLLPLLPAGRDA